MGSRGEFPPVVIGEPQAPPTRLLPQDSILLDQVRQQLPLPAIQPAGDEEQQQWKAETWVTCGAYSRGVALPTKSAETEDTTALRVDPVEALRS